MHIPRRPAFAEEEVRVDLTPLVDVVFLLLIFFVLAVPSIMLPMGIRVKLPISSAAARLPASRMEVVVTAADRIYLAGREVTLAELQRRAAALVAARGLSAQLRCDVAASVGRLVAVYGALCKAGVQRISIATGIKVEEK